MLGRRPKELAGPSLGSTHRSRMLWHARRREHVQPATLQTVVEQVDLALLLQLREQLAPLLLPDLPQVVGVLLPRRLVLLQPLQESPGILLGDHPGAVSVRQRPLLGAVALRQRLALSARRLLLGAEAPRGDLRLRLRDAVEGVLDLVRR